jgi:acyl-homoserine lactone acylase PvdQ
VSGFDALYAAINRPEGPQPWDVTDVIATGSLVAGIFGVGGGGEVNAATSLQQARRVLGPRRGARTWRDFRSANDPEAPTTVHRERFPYRVPSGRRGIAMPDPGSVEPVPTVAGTQGGGEQQADDEDALLDGILNALRQREGGSNALLVAAWNARGGRPLAVFGPQTGYFSPQLLMEQYAHAPGGPEGPPIDARGVSFVGTNLYVQLGRGRDYAWSATSAGQDIIDTFAVELCEPVGGPATKQSMHYRFRGACEPIEVLEQTNSWSPSPADDTPPGSETMRAQRTKLGLVIARANVEGRPVAYTSLRSTYFHEADSALGFVALNDPNAIRGPEDFKEAVSRIGFTFNWFYADHSNIAYFNSGNNPVRARRTSAHFPVSGRFEWRDWNTDLWTARYTPMQRHPQVVNQAFIANWNNKQARGYRAADDNFAYGSIHRSQSLWDRMRAGTRGTAKMSLVELVDAMEDAGTVDLRATEVLPWALRMLRRSRDPQVRGALATLRAWVRSGGHRLDRDRNGVYEHTDAIRILDAWWPLWLRAQFKPALGGKLFGRLEDMLGQDNSPNGGGDHVGSAYIAGWYHYAQKDLRRMLGRRVKGDLSRRYCGYGRRGGRKRSRAGLRRCRGRLEASLKQALAVDPAKLYEDETCADYGKPSDQWCFDAVRHRPVGAINQPLIHWINRPTFQQLVEVQRQVPR